MLSRLLLVIFYLTLAIPAGCSICGSLLHSPRRLLAAFGAQVANLEAAIRGGQGLGAVVGIGTEPYARCCRTGTLHLHGRPSGTRRFLQVIVQGAVIRRPAGCARGWGQSPMSRPPPMPASWRLTISRTGGLAAAPPGPSIRRRL